MQKTNKNKKNPKPTKASPMHKEKKKKNSQKKLSTSIAFSTERHQSSSHKQAQRTKENHFYKFREIWKSKGTTIKEINIVLKKKIWKTKNQQLSLDSAEKWGCMANHCPENWRDRESQFTRSRSYQSQKLVETQKTVIDTFLEAKCWLALELKFLKA